MPGFIAKKLCPDLVIVPVNMEKYAAVSEVVRGVFREYDPNFAPMSLDEAYLDFTELLSKHQEDGEKEVTAWSLVNEMRSKIQERTQLTASAGIAPNCFLAKVCSDLNKPNGQYALRPDPEEVMEFVSGLAIRKVGGIGNVQEQLLKGVGVRTCRDLYEKRAEIRLLFSELSSEFYLAVSQGCGSSRIEPPEDRERKSISTETTFSDESDRDRLLDILRELCKDLSSDCQSKGITGRAVTVKIKSHDFKIKTKVAQLCDYSNDEELMHVTAKKILLYLLDNSEEQHLALRLMGVKLSSLQDKESEDSKPRQKNIMTFIKDAPPVPGSSSNAATRDVSITRFSCPLCNRDCDNLGDLNSHIDKCLEQGGEDQTDTNAIRTHDPPDPLIPDVVRIPAGKKCDEQNRTKSFFRRKLEEFEREKATAAEMEEAEKSVKAAIEDVQSDLAAATDSLSCPVCFKVSFEDETRLSIHVEECLSKKAISALLTSERVPTTTKKEKGVTITNKKRKNQENSKNNAKRSKAEQSTKIDFFFQLKT